ncbi:MAG: acetolactate synthase catalytic subunit [Alphaproteobacteria bacterium]
MTDSNATVAVHLAHAFRRHGVERIFGQSIPSLFLMAAEDLGIAQIGYRTENAGAAMADGYARVARRIGVVTAQNGPAATLLVPGLAEALKSSVPVVAVVQDVPAEFADKNAFQELDHVALFSACAKWTRRLTVPARVDDYVDMAVQAATSGRPGPAVLLVPLDVLSMAAVSGGGSAANHGHFPLDPTRPDDERIAAARRRLGAARLPLAVAGGGVHLSGAAPALARFSRRFGVPVGTTVMGKGAVDERDPLALGVIGNVMGRFGPSHYHRLLFDEADLVVFVGCRTAQNDTDGWTLVRPGTEVMHIDIDPAELGRNYTALRLAGDARLTLEALVRDAAADDDAAVATRVPALARRIAEGRAKAAADAAPLLASNASPLRPERVMAEVEKVLTEDTIVVADASYASVWTSCYLTARKAGMRFLAPRGLAGLGWGLPLAMGAKVAQPDAPVLAFVGDGGFAHVWSELETALRMAIPVVVTVFNNQVLGYQRDAEDANYRRHTTAVDFRPVDHAAIARACGCLGLRVEHAGDYAAALDQARRASLPAVIDVMIDSRAFPPITALQDLHDR